MHLLKWLIKIAVSAESVGNDHTNRGCTITIDFELGGSTCLHTCAQTWKLLLKVRMPQTGLKYMDFMVMTTIS